MNEAIALYDCIVEMIVTIVGGGPDTEYNSNKIDGKMVCKSHVRYL